MSTNTNLYRKTNYIISFYICNMYVESYMKENMIVVMIKKVHVYKGIMYIFVINIV